MVKQRKRIKMHESYTKQSLPSKEYRELLGTALSVFSSNNSFIIENIIRTYNTFDWYELIDRVSGSLKDPIEKTISKRIGNNKIKDLFLEIVEMRNRIIHGFRITSKEGEQVIATKEPKEKGNRQFIITEDYLMDFIRKNDELSDLLHKYRGY